MFDHILNSKSQDKKKSWGVFHIVNKEELKKIGELIMMKELSYDSALSKLKNNYPSLEKIKTSNSLRTHLIKYGYINNPKALANIVKQNSKQEVLKQKRTIIANIVLEELLENNKSELIDILFNDNTFVEKLLSNELFIDFIKSK